MYARSFGDTRHVSTPGGEASLRAHVAAHHTILWRFRDRIDFPVIVRACLAPSRGCILDHAQVLAILVQNIILSPAPLYRIAEWAAPIDCSALRLSHSEKSSINDDRVARSLDALCSVRARGLFFRIALHIIKQFELDTSRIHQDTTTVTFHGKYSTSYAEPRITHGLNKDHRPDLKQLVFGLNVTADGAVPITHEVYSGNRTDETIHRTSVDRLREVLGKEDFIYVADSKLCTRKNLEHVSRYGGKFVTVLPRTRREDKRFRQRLREGAPVRWRRLLEMENKRSTEAPPVIYWTTADGPGETSEGYRLLWYRSSQKMKLDAQARNESLKRAEAELVDLAARMNRGKLCTRSAIDSKVKAILSVRHCLNLLNVTIRSQIITETRYLRRVRPKAGDPVKKVRTRVFQLEVRRVEKARRGAARTDGVCPLLTNLGRAKASQKEVLLM